MLPTPCNNSRAPFLMNTPLFPQKLENLVARVRLPSSSIFSNRVFVAARGSGDGIVCLFSCNVLHPRFPVRSVHQATKIYRAATINNILQSSACFCFWPLLSFKVTHFNILWYVAVLQNSFYALFRSYELLQDSLRHPSNCRPKDLLCFAE